MTPSTTIKFYLTILILFNLSSLSLQQSETEPEDKFTKVCKDLNISKHTTNMTFSEYVQQNGGNSTDTMDFFEQLLFEQTVGDITAIVKKIGFYIFIFVLAVIVLISWICFGVCCVCGCCLFENKRNKKKCFSKLITNIFSIGLFALLAILGYTSIGMNSGFKGYLTGSVCSFFQFFNHTLEGDTKGEDELPRWIGLNYIEKELNETVKEIDEIIDLFIYKINDLEKFLDNQTETYQTEINDSKKNYIEPLPHPQNENEVISPDYVLSFSFMISKIEGEFTTMDTKLDEGVSEMKVQIENVKELISTLTETSQTVVETINQTSDKISEFRGKFEDQVFNIYDLVSSRILLAFQIVFGLFATFALIGGGILVLYCLSESSFCKFIVHILWMGLLLFIVGGLIIGGILGIVGTIASEVIPILANILDESFLTSPEVIEKIGNFTDIVTYLDVCLEGEGDLLNKLEVPLEIEDFDNLISTIKNNLEESYSEGETYKEPTILLPIKSELELYKEYSNAFKNSSTHNSLISNIIDQLNAELVNKESKDQFATLSSNCPNGTTYLPHGGIKEDNIPYCLLVQDWTTVEIAGFFSSYTNLIDKYAILKNFVNAHEVRITDMLTSIKTMEDCYRNSVEQTLEQIKGANATVDSFVDFYDEKIREEGTLIQKFNCVFIKDDLITFIDQLFNNFASQANRVGTVCIICSIIAYIAVIVLITTVHKQSSIENGEIKIELVDS